LQFHFILVSYNEVIESHYFDIFDCWFKKILIYNQFAISFLYWKFSKIQHFDKIFCDKKWLKWKSIWFQFGIFTLRGQ
jgi:hypothetical protein